MKQVLSYGGGLDSFAMLLDAAQRGELPDAVVFCDVGDVRGEDPGEWPSTMRHIHQVVMPLCDRLGVPFHWLHSESGYTVRGERSLFAWMEKRGQIPVSGPSRICTIVAKVERFEAWLNDTYPGERVEVWIGFEAGEESRAANDPNAGKSRTPKPGEAVRVNRFPLIERGMCRCRCEALAREAGLPVPRKSACTFCPYGSRGDWQTLAEELPEVFERVERLESDKMSRPTKRSGVRLSIMGYRKKRPGRLPPNPVRGVHYSAPTLREYIAKPYRPKAKGCPVCGRAERATKATGCSYLDDNIARQAS
jgi:hypothetical protein